MLAFFFGRKVALDDPLAPAERKALMLALGINLLLPVVSPAWVALGKRAAMPRAAALCGRKIVLDFLFLFVELVLLPLPLVTWVLPPEAINPWALLGGLAVWLAVIIIVWLWWKTVTILALRAAEKGALYRFPIVG